MDRLTLDDDTWLLVLTGAGVSAESGVATFRGAGGLWEGHRVEEVASPEGFAADPRLVWRFYGQRRAQVLTVAPNPGHHALVDVERRLGDRFLLATQNVDGLHTRAGSERVVELHGNLMKTRCSRCDREPFHDEDTYADRVPVCGVCHRGGVDSVLRPHIVWFGEMLDPEHLQRVQRFIDQGRLHRLAFMAIGTSGAVWPAAGFVNLVAANGGETWLVNLDPADNARDFDHFVQGPSGTVLPRLFGV